MTARVVTFFNNKGGVGKTSLYSRSVLDQEPPPGPLDPETDDNRIATINHFRSLVPLAQEARKPILALSAADGALGSHATAARDAFNDFRRLVAEIPDRGSR